MTDTALRTRTSQRGSGLVELLVAVVLMRSRKSSRSSRMAVPGAAKDLSTATGNPAELPGV